MPNDDDRPTYYAWENTTAQPPRVEVGPDRNGPATFICTGPPETKNSGYDPIDLGFMEARAIIEGIPARGIDPKTGLPWPYYYGHQMEVVPCPKAAREVAKKENEERAELEKGMPEKGVPRANVANLGDPSVDPTVDLAQYAHLPPPPDTPAPPAEPHESNVTPEVMGQTERNMLEVQASIGNDLPGTDISNEEALDPPIDPVLEADLGQALTESVAGIDPDEAHIEEQLARYKAEVAFRDIEKDLGEDPDDPSLGANPEPPAPTSSPGGAAVTPEELARIQEYREAFPDMPKEDWPVAFEDNEPPLPAPDENGLIPGVDRPYNAAEMQARIDATPGKAAKAAMDVSAPYHPQAATNAPPRARRGGPRPSGPAAAPGAAPSIGSPASQHAKNQRNKRR